MTRRISLALAAAAVAAAFGAGPDALRLATVLPFLVVAPGLAVVPLLHLRDPYAEAVLTVAASLTIDVAVSETLVLTGAFSAPGAIVLLAAACVCGVGTQILTDSAAQRASLGPRPPVR